MRALVGDSRASPSTEVVGVESDAATATPSTDLTPTLSGSIADQELTQGTAYTSADAFPAATGGEAPISYSVGNLPSGITFNGTTRKLTGTANTPQAITELTYTATDSDATDPDSATLTFNISVKPKQPRQLSARVGAGEVHLYWSAIAGVDGWEYSQDGGSWTAIPKGTAYFTTQHTVTGLTAGTEYAFRVRAFVGTGNTRVDGPASDTIRATPDTGTRPREPELPGAVPGNGQVKLTWAGMTQGSGVTGWEYQQDGGAWTAITGSIASTTSHTVTGLTNGEEYRFKVRAVAGTEKGVESDTIYVVPQAQ